MFFFGVYSTNAHFVGLWRILHHKKMYIIPMSILSKLSEAKNLTSLKIYLYVFLLSLCFL